MLKLAILLNVVVEHTLLAHSIPNTAHLLLGPQQIGLDGRFAVRNLLEFVALVRAFPLLLPPLLETGEGVQCHVVSDHRVETMVNIELELSVRIGAVTEIEAVLQSKRKRKQDTLESPIDDDN